MIIWINLSLCYRILHTIFNALYRSIPNLAIPCVVNGNSSSNPSHNKLQDEHQKFK